LIAFEEYAKIKNNYCICYFGQSDEYLVALELLRPLIERSFPGMNFYISCRDESLTVLADPSNKVLPISQLKIKKDTFAHIKELKYEQDGHPVERFVTESGLMNLGIPISLRDLSDIGMIVTHGNYPTKPLTARQIAHATKVVQARGLRSQQDGDWRHAGLLIGVESVSLIRAAASGIPVILFDNGIGTKFLKKMFPSIEILTLE